MHCSVEIPQICHTFALFDAPQVGNLMIPDRKNGVEPKHAPATSSFPPARSWGHWSGKIPGDKKNHQGSDGVQRR